LTPASKSAPTRSSSLFLTLPLLAWFRGCAAKRLRLPKPRHAKNRPHHGIHLWFDREVMTDPFVTLLDTTTQWIFNKTALYGP